VRYITPRCPEQNGKVERSHRVDEEEFWSRTKFDDFARAAEAVRAWEGHYNQERFSIALKGLTSAEKLATFLPLQVSSLDPITLHKPGATS
jgi:transposase InsO family protein